MARIECATFTVAGTPAPQGSKRHVGKGIMVESSKKVAPWRDSVTGAAIEWRKANGLPEAFDGPLVASMVFTLRKPTSAPKTIRIFPMKPPDLSKLARSTEDALVEACLIKDDARIVGYDRLWKVYPGEGIGALPYIGAAITVWTMAEYMREVEQQGSFLT